MIQTEERPSQLMFWGCFIALITTAFAFVTRTFMVNMPGLWSEDFGLDKVQQAALFGHGLWPFAISIILFSLVIDRIGYRTAMIFSFICYVVYAALALMAHAAVNVAGLEGDALVAAQAQGLRYLTIGSIILGLGNGTVEAFINPVVATIFHKEKTKWLNILHAGWPGGLVLGGILTLALQAQVAEDWRILIYIIALPAIVYLLMLIGATFPVSERVAAGGTFREMLAEFGALGAAIAVFLIGKQLALEVKNAYAWEIPDLYLYLAMGVCVVGYGVYCQSLGRPLMVFLCLVMIPLATTELGIDGTITGLMETPMKAAELSPLWVLIYTSCVMMILRFFAGPVVKALTPLGLLATCAVCAALGIYLLSFATATWAIFLAATIYGIGKTYFWPTTLGVVAEQFPKGGALTLNAIAGIGMLAVGIIGLPLIGYIQEDSSRTAIQKNLPNVYETISKTDNFFLGQYQAVDADKVAQLTNSAEVTEVINQAKQSSLSRMIVFPIIMLAAYLVLLAYFKSQGGYRPKAVLDH